MGIYLNYLLMCGLWHVLEDFTWYLREVSPKDRTVLNTDIVYFDHLFALSVMRMAFVLMDTSISDGRDRRHVRSRTRSGL